MVCRPAIRIPDCNVQSAHFRGARMAGNIRIGIGGWTYAPWRGTFYPPVLPKSVAGQSIRHAVVVRHERFCCPDCLTSAREHEVAIVTAGDSAFPQIADPSAPFAYLRIMGTAEAEPLGYATDALDLWAGRARAIADGRVPEGLAMVAEATDTGPRDVFLYVIAGHKPGNPAAAMALIERINRAG